MKILHCDYDSLTNPYAGGGQAKATYQLYRRLAQRHSVTVITGNYPGAKNEIVEKIHYKRVGFGFMGPTVSMLSYWFLLPFYTLVEKKDITVEFFTAPFGVSLVPLVNKPIIGYASFLGARELAQKYKIPFHILEKVIIGWYSQIITLTDTAHRELTKKYPRLNIQTIPRGVEDEILNLKPVEQGYVLYLGRVDIYQKSIDLIIEAWSLVSKQVKRNIKLLIVGNGKKEDLDNLENLVNKLQLSQSVELKGRVDGEEKLNLLAKCIIFLAPSRFETFGNSALEGLAAGKPLIISDIPGYSWIPKKSSYKVARLTGAHLAEAIEDLLENKSKRVKLSSSAKEFAQKYKWVNITNNFEKVLQNTVNQ